MQAHWIVPIRIAFCDVLENVQDAQANKSNVLECKSKYNETWCLL